MNRWLAAAAISVGLVSGVARADGNGAAPAPAAAVAGRIKVAIVPTVAVNLDAARVDALTADLAEALVGELDIDAVGGLEVRRLLPAVGVPPECMATPACTEDVAKRLQVTQILFLVMVGTGNALQVDTTWVEPATSKQAARPPTDVANMNDAKVRFAAVAHALLPDAPVRKKIVPGGGGTNGVMSKAVPLHFTTVSYVTAAVTVVGIGVGASLGFLTRGKYNDCDSPAANCAQSKKDSIRLTGLLADGGWLVAIGGAVATSILYATSGESPHLILAPAESSTGGVGGVTIGAIGRF